MERAAPYLILIGRIILSIIFIQSGWGKIFGYAGTAEHMNAAGVPGALLPLVILTELGGGFLVLLGLFTTNFMKNITIAGGFLVLAGSGPGALALDNLRR